MARVGTSHVKVIVAMRERFRPFTVAEVSRQAHVSKPQVRDVLETLALLGYVRHRAASRTDKWWVKTQRWGEDPQVIVAHYDIFKAVQRGRRLAARRLSIRPANAPSGEVIDAKS